MLKQLRTARGWSVQETVNYAKPRHGDAVTWNVLTRLEAGKTKHPDAESLRALADLYAVDYSELATAFIARNYGRDLPRHAGTGSSAVLPGEGGTHGATAARVQQLEHRLKTYEAIVRKSRQLAEAIVVTTGAGLEGAQAAGRRASRRRRD